MSKIISRSVDLDGKSMSFEVGRFAQQATSAVVGRLGDTMVLATVVEGRVKEGLGYFPLSVEYAEKLYAGGRIKGSRWVKREGRASDDAILKGRLIDRSIRPLFPKDYMNEVQVIVTVLSVDGENDADILAINTVSCALAISHLPWSGPIASLRVGFVQSKEEGQKPSFVINPTFAEMDFSELDLVVTHTKEKVLMLEAGANQVSEDDFLSAIKFSQKARDEILKVINEIASEVGQKKKEVSHNDVSNDLLTVLEEKHAKEIQALVENRASKENQGDEGSDLAKAILSETEEKYSEQEINTAIDKLFKKYVRKNILEKNMRADKRGLKEIRPIEIEIGVLPRTHGSAMFKRGQTQALSITTLGTPSLEQLLEKMEGEETKRYMHHYYMPPYSVGEAGRFGMPSRREIGHGALAERAILPVLPSDEKFPYAIRVVSEVLSSNGSTSMASTCGSCLSLMDAGVPISDPVAGIACGLITSEDGKDYRILTDIVGIEDFCGDMDFKVAGTNKGITAVQLDVKINGLSEKIISETLLQSKEARLEILNKMIAVIASPRTSLSKFAPKVKVVKIDTEKIGEVIGPGGRVIRQIMAQTNTTLDVSDDGTVSVSGVSSEEVDKAVDWVQMLTRQIKINEEFEGEVKRILPFGAFVELIPGKEGMVHVSQMSTGFVNNPTDVVNLGQKVKVRVMEIDDQGRINLSMLFGDDANKVKDRNNFRNNRDQKPFFNRPPRRPFNH